ncbi:hypothetical protein PSHT_12212 [Puccinia striiformis]|uniref:Uncharacterized protein n=2 Tax=Puccinia striiformis TaxID=27350 RepID=A0A2S4UY95_9BASI|nr:hypothetical protein PSHT_12212 [Puccinia striiformis]
MESPKCYQTERSALGSGWAILVSGPLPILSLHKRLHGRRANTSGKGFIIKSSSSAHCKLQVCILFLNLSAVNIKVKHQFPSRRKSAIKICSPYLLHQLEGIENQPSVTYFPGDAYQTAADLLNLGPPLGAEEHIFNAGLTADNPPMWSASPSNTALPTPPAKQAFLESRHDWHS